MQQVGKVSVTNEGGSPVRIEFQYLDSDGDMKTTSAGPDIPLGQTCTVDPGSFGVPDGATFWVIVIVGTGQRIVAESPLQYESGNPNVAHYVVSGEPTDLKLQFTGTS